jgi:hypothetical protein
VPFGAAIDCAAPPVVGRGVMEYQRRSWNDADEVELRPRINGDAHDDNRQR